MANLVLNVQPRLYILLLCCVLCIPLAIGTSLGYKLEPQGQQDNQRPLWEGSNQHDGSRKIDLQSLQKPLPGTKNPDTLPALLDALDVLQNEFFAVWQGLWPTSIDWTSAVIGTYLSAALTTLSTSFPLLPTSSEQRYPSKQNENRINKYFSQLVASYFGQDAFSLRNEAYDDMLWVVLGWLESIKFINIHSSLHYKTRMGDQPWYGTQWIPAFAHRARLFWDLASQGWDTDLCDGGMIWSPYLAPYKNAITNELFIAASISMYLYFPGDTNSSPFFPSHGGGNEPPGGPTGPQDPKYLAAAIEAYKWLNGSNMTNEQGLYVDGFHVSGLPDRPYKNDTQGNTKCDARNDMVYTYNQGVLLTGQRGLYEATSARSYLEDGHKLIKDVIAATGYDLRNDRAFDDANFEMKKTTTELPQWYGLGRSGILEEVCDAGGYCSQNGHTFKGIFFHHLTSFCSQLPPHLIKPGETFNIRQFQVDKDWHDANCKEYKSWIFHNAHAALGTKDEDGKFGTWWGAPKTHIALDIQVEMPAGAVDYMNPIIPEEKMWINQNGAGGILSDGEAYKALDVDLSSRDIKAKDLNDRGRGRTVETQGGGLSVLRAAWEWEGRI